MDLNLVRVFTLVADTRSFTAAARTLGVPTSSVSRAVARLEAAMGTKLFERTSRKTSLSAAGRLYLDFAQRALEALTEGEARMSELIGQAKGEIKITVPNNLDEGFFARQLVAFAALHPHVTLTVEPSNRWIEMADEGFDLALRVRQRSLDSDLAMHELGAFHAWLVAAPHYLEAHGRPRRPRDLARHPCVSMLGHRMTLDLIGPRGEESVEVGGPIATNDMQLARQLVEQGAGIGALVFPPGETRPLGERLVRVLPSYIVRGPSLFVVTATRRELPLRVRLLRAFLIDAYRATRSGARAYEKTA